MNDKKKNTAFLKLTVSKKEKSAWVRAAFPGKLEDWICEHLNRAARFGGDTLQDKDDETLPD